MSLITAEFVRGILDYNSQSGVFRWRCRSDVHPSWNARHVGNIAGCFMMNGYCKISILSKAYLAHRLAWIHTFGEFPKQELDHINGCVSDNRINNLRCASRRQNATNTPVRCDNSSGYRGVYWHKSAKKWHASIKVGGKNLNLGLFADILEAAAAYENASKQHHGEYRRRVI